MEPPTVLRIKRKRHQDPLQALILEDSRKSKRSKPSTPHFTPDSTPPPDHNVYFTLARTDVHDDKEIVSLSSNTQNKFIIPKQLESIVDDSIDIDVDNKLSDMVKSFLNVEEPSEPVKRKKRTKKVSIADEVSDLEYVYDVYYISKDPLTSANHPKTQIGYIRFFDDNSELYQSDDEDNPVPVSDNEDSNAEDFYQNDYPSDEDAGSLSETSIVNEDEIANEFELDENYFDSNLDYLQDDTYYNDNSGFDNDLDNTEQYYESDAEYNDLSINRNVFFKSDKDDHLAIHRDMIFGKLQNMINEHE